MRKVRIWLLFFCLFVIIFGTRTLAFNGGMGDVDRFLTGTYHVFFNPAYILEIDGYSLLNDSLIWINPDKGEIEQGKSISNTIHVETTSALLGGYRNIRAGYLLEKVYHDSRIDSFLERAEGEETYYKLNKSDYNRPGIIIGYRIKDRLDIALQVASGKLLMREYIEMYNPENEWGKEVYGESLYEAWEELEKDLKTGLRYRFLDSRLTLGAYGGFQRSSLGEYIYSYSSGSSFTGKQVYQIWSEGEGQKELWGLEGEYSLDEASTLRAYIENRNEKKIKKTYNALMPRDYADEENVSYLELGLGLEHEFSEKTLGVIGISTTVVDYSFNYKNEADLAPDVFYDYLEKDDQHKLNLGLKTRLLPCLTLKMGIEGYLINIQKKEERKERDMGKEEIRTDRVNSEDLSYKGLSSINYGAALNLGSFTLDWDFGFVLISFKRDFKEYYNYLPQKPEEYRSYGEDNLFFTTFSLSYRF